MKKIFVAILFAATSAFAADVTAIKAARMIDGRGGAIISPAIVIDLGDSTILPGLIDAHVHLLLQGDVTTEEYDNQLFKESMPYRALRASRAAKIGLEHGFTTMRVLET